MIIKINKNFNDLSIGVCGSRKNLLVEVLNKFNKSCSIIENHKDITSDFDFVFVSGMYSLLKPPHLFYPKYGIFGFHETPLPEGKGSAPIQWTILNNRPNMTISLFKLEEGMDCGDIICQENISIDNMDVYDTLEEKRSIAIKKCFQTCLEELMLETLVLRKQSGQESFNKKRSADSSELDINKPLKELWNNIRICDNEKFPAFFKLNNKKVVLKYFITDN